MRLSPSLVVPLFLAGATASAHEPRFDAIWVQPLATVVARSPIVSLGWTHGLSPGLDLATEVTPYLSPTFICGIPDCPSAVFGLIATTGPSFGLTLFASDVVEMGLFAGGKLLMAGTIEADGEDRDTAFEVGGGLDAGFEIHSRKVGIYAALVLGWQISGVFRNGAGLGRPPSAPLPLISTLPSGNAAFAWTTGPNVNLFRVGVAF